MSSGMAFPLYRIVRPIRPERHDTSNNASLALKSQYSRGAVFFRGSLATTPIRRLVRPLFAETQAILHPAVRTQGYLTACTHALMRGRERRQRGHYRLPTAVGSARHQRSIARLPRTSWAATERGGK